MSCERLRDLLPRYADGDLERDEQLLVWRHLAGCAACRQRLELDRELAAALRSLPPLPDADLRGARLRQRLFERLGLDAGVPDAGASGEGGAPGAPSPRLAGERGVDRPLPQAGAVSGAGASPPPYPRLAAPARLPLAGRLASAAGGALVLALVGLLLAVFAIVLRPIAERQAEPGGGPAEPVRTPLVATPDAALPTTGPGPRSTPAPGAWQRTSSALAPFVVYGSGALDSLGSGGLVAVELPSGQKLGEVDFGSQGWGFALAPDGRRAYLLSYTELLELEAPGLRVLRRTPLPHAIPTLGSARTVAVSPDGRQVYAETMRIVGPNRWDPQLRVGQPESEYGLAVYDVARGAFVGEIKLGPPWCGVADLHTLPDGRLAVLCLTAAELRLVDPQQGTQLASVRVPGVVAGVPSPDGRRYLAVDSAGSLSEVHLDRLVEERRIGLHDDRSGLSVPFQRLHTTADGKLLVIRAAPGDDEARARGLGSVVWVVDTASLARVAQVPLPGPAFDAVPSPDGRALLIGNANTRDPNERVTRLVEVPSGRELARWPGTLVGMFAGPARPLAGGRAPVAASPTPAAAPSPTPAPAGPAATGPRPALRLAFVRVGDVYLLDAATGAESRLTEDGRNGQPWWTSDGRTLFFTKTAGDQRQTWRWRAETGVERVADGLWSPDGAAVAFEQPVSDADRLAAPWLPGGQAVWLERAGRRSPITPAEPDARWRALAWSPDGQRLALARFQPTGPEGPPGKQESTAAATLWVTEGDLFAARLRQLAMPPSFQDQPGWPDAVVWSPDGRYLAVGAGPNSPCNSCRADGLLFFAVPVDGSPAVQLDASLHTLTGANWAPGGSFIALSAPGGRETYVNKHLLRVDLPGGAHTWLARDERYADLAPAVAPDGRQVAFARGWAQVGGQPQGPIDPALHPNVATIASRRLWLVGADGSNPRQVLPDAGWTEEAPAWTADGQWLLFVRWRPSKPDQPGTAELWAARPDGSAAQRLVAQLGPPSSPAGDFGFYGSYGWRSFFALAP